MEDSIFILSNGCVELYPDNTLTSFENDLPRQFNLNPFYKFEMAVQKIGLSTDFRILKKDHINPLDIDIIICKLKKDFVYPFKLSDPSNELSDIVLKTFGFPIEEKKYSIASLEKLVKLVNRTSDELSKLRIDQNRLVFDFNTTEPYLVLMTEAFMTSFGILQKSQVDKLPEVLNFNTISEKEYKIHELKLENAPLESFYNTSSKTYYTTQTYKKIKKPIEYLFNLQNNIFYGYFIYNQATSLHGIHDMNIKPYPRLIKVKCSNIQPQIFNNTMSSDLIQFTPKYENISTDNYYFHEFENLQYCVLQNTILKTIKIELTDEKDIQLELFKGPATIIQLKFRRMPLFDQTTNIRISSIKTDDFPSNKANSFKVNLPTTLNLDKNWKVALTTINYPTLFTTFPNEEKHRRIIYNGEGNFGDETTRTDYDFYLPSNMIYNISEVSQVLNVILRSKRIGFVELKVDKLKLSVNKIHLRQRLIISNQLLEMLGYNGAFDDGDYTKFLFTSQDHEEKCIGYIPASSQQFITFKNPINPKYFHPQYMFVYASLISPTILSNTYQKILKVIPIAYFDRDHVVSEFRSKDYCDLQNTDIREFEIEIRSHDGNLINFIDISEVMMNLEFKNYGF